MTYMVQDGKSAFHISQGEIPSEFGDEQVPLCSWPRHHQRRGGILPSGPSYVLLELTHVPPRTVELLWLSALAGIVCPTDLASTVLTWLGGIFPKNRACSTGDKR